MLERYPRPKDWHHVRFSDEVHFGWGPQGKILIIRKPGMRYCQDCIQEEAQPAEKDRKRFHCWAAIGYNFKSLIHFYNVPGNTNGKMSQRIYIDSILEPIVKPWLNVVISLFWRKMEILGMVLGETTSSRLGKKSITWTTILIAQTPLIWHLLRTAGSHQRQSFVRFHIGMTVPQKS
jgi:hypothetical protein